jgi:hypothetical protein
LLEEEAAATAEEVEMVVEVEEEMVEEVEI